VKTDVGKVLTIEPVGKLKISQKLGTTLKE
jgi:hypothetical protein